MGLDRPAPTDRPLNPSQPHGDQGNAYSEINKTLKETGFSTPGNASGKTGANEEIEFGDIYSEEAARQVAFRQEGPKKPEQRSTFGSTPETPAYKDLSRQVQTGLAALLDNEDYRKTLISPHRGQVREALLAFGSETEAAKFLEGGAKALSTFVAAPALKQILKDHGLTSDVIYNHSTGKVEGTILSLPGTDTGLITRFKYETKDGKDIPHVAGVDVVKLELNKHRTGTDMLGDLNRVKVAEYPDNTNRPKDAIKDLQAKFHQQVLASLAKRGGAPTAAETSTANRLAMLESTRSMTMPSTADLVMPSTKDLVMPSTADLAMPVSPSEAPTPIEHPGRQKKHSPRSPSYVNLVPDEAKRLPSSDGP